MTRLLACAVMFGGCLAMVGCDTGAGTGSVPPLVSATKNRTNPEDKKDLGKSSVAPTKSPDGGGAPKN
jgi:hypothetical protein